MKILITGFNKNQCTRKFYLRQQLKVIPSHYSLFNALTDMGHEVEQRQVVLGEDLSGYDEVIVFIAGPRQLVATTVYEGLWAIYQRPDCILAFDDWQVPDLFKGVAKCLDPKELFAQFILDVNKKTLEQMQPYENQLATAINTITLKRNRMLISAFQTGHLKDAENYGPHLLFDKIEYPNDRLFVYNPNPYHRNRSWYSPGHEGIEDPTWTPPLLRIDSGPPPERERGFNFASLVQSKTKKWLKKQGYTANADDDESGKIRSNKMHTQSMGGGMLPGFHSTPWWTVDLYGSKADTQKRLTEDEMVKVITRDWGCLMPGYSHAGSGWWRARPLQCADAKSILIGDDKEMRVYYGDDYDYFGLVAADLVTLDDDELVRIAYHQSDRLYRHHPLEKSIQKAELQAVLDAKK